MLESTPLQSGDQAGQVRGSEAPDPPLPESGKKAPSFWNPRSWLSFDALGWYVLIVLVLVVFAPFRSVLQGNRGKNVDWGLIEGQKPEVIGWEVLGELDLYDQSMTPGLAALDGQMVALPGYLIPLDDDFENATEYLMVPYFGACTHVPPPPENQMVHVRMQRKIEVDPYGWDPIWVAGRLRIGSSDMAFGIAAFQMEGFDSQPYSPADSGEN